MTMDQHDRQKLADAYRDHRRAINAFHSLKFVEGEEQNNEKRYYDTLQHLDEVCEEIQVTYGDNVANLEQLLEDDQEHDPLRQDLSDHGIGD